MTKELNPCLAKYGVHLYGIYNRDSVLEQLNKLPEKQKKVIMESYGINGVELKKIAEIAKEIGVSKTSIINYRKNAIKKLREKTKDLGIIFFPDFKKICEEDKQRIVKALGNYVFCSSVQYEDEQVLYNVGSLAELAKLCQEIEKYGMIEMSAQEKERIEIEKEIKFLQEQGTGDNVSISVLELPIKTYRKLIKSAMNSVRDIIEFDEEKGLDMIKNIKKEEVDEIRRKINNG